MRRASALLALAVLILIDIWVLSYLLPLIASVYVIEKEAWWAWLGLIGFTALIFVPLYLTWLVARPLLRRSAPPDRSSGV